MISAVVGIALVVIGILHWVGTISGTVTLACLTIGVGLLAILQTYPLIRRAP